jgi:hypothetical protein
VYLLCCFISTSPLYTDSSRSLLRPLTMTSPFHARLSGWLLRFLMTTCVKRLIGHVVPLSLVFQSSLCAISGEHGQTLMPLLHRQSVDTLRRFTSQSLTQLLPPIVAIAPGSHSSLSSSRMIHRFKRVQVWIVSRALQYIPSLLTSALDNLRGTTSLVFKLAKPSTLDKATRHIGRVWIVSYSSLVFT